MERQQGLKVYKARIDDSEGVEVEKVIIKLWNTARLPRPSESGMIFPHYVNYRAKDGEKDKETQGGFSPSRNFYVRARVKLT